MRSLALALAALTLGACACDLHDEILDWAGDGADSCGFVRLGDPAAGAHACALEHLEAGEPFALWVELRGTDSHVVEAWAGRADGSVGHFLYDGDPSGGGGDGDPHIARWSCDNPHRHTVTADEGLHGVALAVGDVVLRCEQTVFIEDLCP